MTTTNSAPGNGRTLAGLAGLALALMLVAPPPGSAQTEQRQPAAADATITIHSQSGDVRVAGWGREEILVRSTSRERDVALAGSRSAPTVRSRSGRLEVQVPRGSRVQIRTMSGDVEVREVPGDLEIASMSGDIRVGGTIRTLIAEAVSGDITLDGRADVVRAKSVSGDVRIPDARRSADLSSVSGDVHLTARGLRDARVNSVSGRVRFDGTFARDATLSFESASGIIELRVPRNVPADYTVTTITGRIRNDIGPAPERRSDFVPGEELRFSTGTGGARINVQNVSGSVRISPP
jgi:DUF4097 and DUF4098 domain-containing protein YvlB